MIARVEVGYHCRVGLMDISADVRRRVVLVTGMHRSGTSLIALMLRRAGMHFGGPLLDEPRSDAPLGYGEHAAVVALHEDLLARLGRTWHGPDGAQPLPHDWQRRPETLRVRQTLGDLIDRELHARRSWFVKDPRISRLLPMWLGLLEERDVAVEAVLCVRHPSAVAGSLARRNGMSEEQALRVWQAHLADFLDSFGYGRARIVAYDVLLRAPQTTFAKLLWALEMDADDADIEAACALALPSHRHHFAAAYPSGAPRWQVVAQQFHDRLLRDAGDSGGPAAASASASGHSVAIVMRTRDRPPFLRRALRSVLAQTYPRWHLYVVNDGGEQAPVDDALAPYLTALGDRLSVIHLARRVGMEAASNRAIAAASEDVIAIHDDDDSWQPAFLATCVARMRATGARGVVTASIMVRERSVGLNLTALHSSRFLPDMTGVYYHELVVANRFPPIAFVYDRQVIAEIGNYRGDLPVLGDWDFNLRFAARHAIEFVDAPLANWHRRATDDAFPNSGTDVHAQVSGLLRDERLREAGPAAAAIVGAIAPSVRRSLLEAHGPLLDAIGSGVAALLGRTNHGDAAQTRVLMPVSWESIDRQGDGWISRNGDPQIRLQSLEPPLAAGRWHVSVELTVPADHGCVQLYFSERDVFSEPHSLLLRPEGPGHFGGVLTAPHPVRHLRLDPMARPGPFHLGPVAVTGSARNFPDFLCIGAQRSGTTWLHRNLAGHGDVWLPPAKEIHFFDSMFGADGPRWARDRLRFLADCQREVLNGADGAPEHDDAWHRLAWAARFATSRTVDAGWYASLFAEAPSGTVRGDITPGYAVLPEEAVACAARLMPDMKILFVMRDPIERALSGALHELTTAAGTRAVPSAGAFEAALHDPRCVARSDYRATIERWERHVPPERMTYLFFDQLRGVPHDMLRQVCGALDIPFAASRFPLASQPQNENSVIADGVATAEHRRMLAERSMADLEWLSDRFGDHAKEWFLRAQRLVARSRGGCAPGVPTVAPTRPNIVAGMRQVTEMHGPWVSHNIALAEGLLTIGEAPTGDGLRLRRFLAASEALLGPVGRQTRVLDLACGEGLYALEYARRGAQVVAVEVRTANFARACLAKWALALPNLDVIQDDVRHVSSATYGRFDIVICSGILYHLDTPDVFAFVETIADMTTRVAVFDTRIALHGVTRRRWRDHDYEGTVYREHAATASAQERDAAIWSSHLNHESFWLTLDALLRLLECCGFTTVMQLHRPAPLTEKIDRVTLLALRGELPRPIVTPTRALSSRPG